MLLLLLLLSSVVVDDVTVGVEQRGDACGDDVDEGSAGDDEVMVAVGTRLGWSRDVLGADLWDSLAGPELEVEAAGVKGLRGLRLYRAAGL